MIIIYVLIQFKVLIYSPPKNVYGPLTFRIYYHWSVDHHNALQLTTGLKRVTIQPVFNQT